MPHARQSSGAIIAIRRLSRKWPAVSSGYCNRFGRFIAGEDVLKSVRVAVTTIFLAICLVSVGGCASDGGSRGRYESGPEYGLASWYGRPYHGRRTASGERYNMREMTAAHPNLPFGTRVRVTNLQNNKSADVRINDRGPFVRGRIIDVSRAAARKLDMVRDGVVRVRVDILQYGD